jgi:hypothetical protein
MYNRIRHYSHTPYPKLRVKVLAAVEHVKAEQHRSPTINELSLDTGASPEWILEAMEFNVHSHTLTNGYRECSLH